ncbi:hypothetical protein MKX01_035214 [Papaver californicum]|nr:hypothetical protein MKX01_035214 [Papaver californicum]
MSSFRKLKLAINSFQNLGSKILNGSRNTIREGNDRLNRFISNNNSSLISNIFRVSGCSFSSLIRSKIYSQQNHKRNLFLNGGGLDFFDKRWFENPRIPVVVLIIRIVVTVYAWNCEIIPLTNKTHFVFLSRDLERKMGEDIFEEIKLTYQEKILPAMHPVIVQVRFIAKGITEALERGIRHKHVWSAGMANNKLEILVVNEPIINDFCVPPGKIFIFTGLLDHFRSDVGHVVARHEAEQLSDVMLFTNLHIVLMKFIGLPSLRNEMEEDYIGLLLLASDGYDPQEVPQLYKKLGEISGQPSSNDYFSTHPSGKKRAKELSRAKVMDEALKMYRDSNSCRGVEQSKASSLSEENLHLHHTIGKFFLC